MKKKSRKKPTKKKPTTTRKPTKKRRVVFVTNVPPVERSSEERLRDQCAALGALGRATIASLERQDRRDWETNKKYEHEPMTSEPVWHPHRQH